LNLFGLDFKIMNSSVQFPDPNLAEPEGIVAMGGELSPDFLLSAYNQGLFPWFNEGEPILWWSPDPRMVLFPENFKISASMKQTIRRNKFTLKVDHDFVSVIRNCASVKRDGQQGTWITEDMIGAYTNLHKEGYAHSFETYQEGKLVGGLYGVSLGKAFFGESMFYLERDASKFALYHLVRFARENDFHFIDVQQSTNHLRSLGAVNISRAEFLDRLRKSLAFSSIKKKWSGLID